MKSACVFDMRNYGKLPNPRIAPWFDLHQVSFQVVKLYLFFKFRSIYLKCARFNGVFLAPMFFFLFYYTRKDTFLSEGLFHIYSVFEEYIRLRLLFFALCLNVINYKQHYGDREFILLSN